MRHGTNGERASAAVEFALVLPLVLIMALALVQVGLLVKDQLILAGAARAGAREGAVSREGGAGSAVRVSMLYHAPVAVPFVGWLFPSSVDLSANATMRQETG